MIVQDGVGLDLGRTKHNGFIYAFYAWRKFLDYCEKQFRIRNRRPAA